jgi:LmbE family N-acetylglucosaminyl deacetylase
MSLDLKKTVVIIVAHPDDETIWAGGTILSNAAWQVYIICLSRKNDRERAPKFFEALKVLKAKGIMGDLDDGPEQWPLDEKIVENAIQRLLPPIHFDLIISHNPTGEYTRHLRHEEIGKAVIKLWYAFKLPANELWTFAYEDSKKSYNPKPIENATIYNPLPEKIWQQKYSIITDTYGFKKDSFEAATTPKAEAFWQFMDPYDANKWLKDGGILKNKYA